MDNINILNDNTDNYYKKFGIINDIILWLNNLNKIILKLDIWVYGIYNHNLSYK